MKIHNTWRGELRVNAPLWAYYLLVLSVLMFASGPAMGASTGTTGASFLKIAVGPRAAAMGSAYTAVAEEAYALYYNPALIGMAEKWDLSAMHQDQFAQVNFDYFGLTAPAIKNRSAWGVSFVRMAVDDYSRTELDDGAKFTNSDIALTGTYAHRIFKPLTVGFSGKIIKQTLAQYTANGWAVDFGAHLKVNPRLSLGAALLHIGPKITFISIGDPLPTTFRVGGAFKLLPRGNLLATMDYWIPRDDADGVGIGMEYRPSRYLALRSGYQIGTDFTGFDASSYGVTFNFENFGIEYAFVPREKLGDVHRAGLNVSFGGKKQKVIAARPRTQRRREMAKETRGQTTPAPVKPTKSPARPRPARTEPIYDQPESAPSAAPAPARSVADVTSLRHSARPAVQEAPSIVELPVVDASLEPPAPVEEEIPAPTPSPVVPAFAAKDREAIVQEKVSLASGLMKEKRFMEAIVIIRSGLAEEPQNIPLWYLLSESLYQNGEYDLAMEAVNKALSIMHGNKSGVIP